MTPVKHAYEGPPWELIFWRDLATPDMRPMDPRYGLRMEESLDLIPLSPGAVFSALDVGCGIGLYAFGLSRRWPGARLHAVDINAGQIAYAAERARALGFAGRLSFAVADAEALTGLEGPFDVIQATEVIEHLDRPEMMLRRLRAVCAPRGWLVLSAPGAPDHHGHVERTFRQLMPEGRYRESTNRGDLDPSRPIFELTHRHFAPGELEGHLESTGWRVVRQRWIRFDHEELEKVHPRLGRIWKRVQGGRLARVVARPRVDRALNALSRGRFADSVLLLCQPSSPGGPDRRP
jgi:SAM-dependent methyltransferase